MVCESPRLIASSTTRCQNARSSKKSAIHRLSRSAKSRRGRASTRTSAMPSYAERPAAVAAMTSRASARPNVSIAATLPIASAA